MEMVIDSKGGVRCIYGEEIDLVALGQATICRASHVEPDGQGQWWANLGPVGGPILGPFPRRTEALAAEVTWLQRNWFSTVEQLEEHRPSAEKGDRP
jgi:hypothetical protein